jgi:hypothetical protein
MLGTSLKLLSLHTHASLALLCNEPAKLLDDVGNQARLLLQRGAAYDQVGKALSHFRGEVWYIDRFTRLKCSPQPLFNEFVDVVVKGTHERVLTLPLRQR